MMLYIVATPIGNLGDITLRALEVLKKVDIIACEDTRHTRILLAKYNILPKKSEALNSKSETNSNNQNSNKNSHSGDDRTPESDSGQARMTSQPRLVSYHQHSGISKTNQIIHWLKEGKEVAIVTDAGTPGISDPGSKLIKEAIASSIDIVSIPGPSAFVCALSVSGFDTTGFLFIGFLPNKKGRQTKLKEIANEKRTIVLYESVHRIKKLLRELNENIPEREICVTRELTKKFEEIIRGKPAEVLEKIKEKGEFTVIIEGDVSYQRGGTADNTPIFTEKRKVDLLYPELSYKIRGIAMKVRKELGSGQKESIYQNLFKEKLLEDKIKFEKEKPVIIRSKNFSKSLGSYRPDFVIDRKIILELKAVQFLPKNQESQLFDYLKSSDYQLGFIINFGGKKLYIKRIIYSKNYKDIFSENQRIISGGQCE